MPSVIVWGRYHESKQLHVSGFETQNGDVRIAETKR